MKGLSIFFRRLFLKALREAFESGLLAFFDDIATLRLRPAFKYLQPLKDMDWVVYAKPPVGGARHALQYLGRYALRLAISNQRLLLLTEREVRFQWKDYRHKHKEKSRQMTIAVDEFIRRFLLHTLPPGFQRIRHFGFLANCHRKGKLALCRQFLAASVTDLLPSPEVCREWLKPPATAESLAVCRQCGKGVMQRIQILPVYPWPLHPPDTA